MFPTLRQAVPIALPVMIGYFTVGATFGLTAAEAGFGWFWPVIISLIQFAGAAQFLIVAMVSKGAGFIDTAAVVTFPAISKSTLSDARKVVSGR